MKSTGPLSKRRPKPVNTQAAATVNNTSGMMSVEMGQIDYAKQSQK